MKKILSLVCSLVIAFGWLALLPVPKAYAVVCTWTGTNSGNWNDSGNWSGCSGSVPTTNDDVYITGGNYLGSMDNDIPGTLSLASLNIQTNGVNLIGNDIEMIVLNLEGNSGGIHNNLTMEGSGPSITNDGTGNTIYNPVAINADPGTDFNFYVDQDFSPPAFTGTMQNFNKWGSGTFNAATGSTFTNTGGGGVNIHDGTIDCISSNCLGNSTNQVVQRGTGKLYFGASMAFSNPIYLNAINDPASVGVEVASGVGVSASGAVIMGGPSEIVIGGGSAAFQLLGTTANLSSMLIISGNSAAGSSFNVTATTLTGSGELRCMDVTCSLQSNSPAYDGVIRGQIGSIITHSASQSLGTTVGNTIIENGAMLLSPDGSDITTAENISVEGTGVSGQGAIRNEDTTGTRTLSGTITLTGDTLIFNRDVDGIGPSADLVFSGVIAGAGDLTFSGSGLTEYIQLEGSSANTYSGTTMVNNAQVILAKDPGVVAIPGDLQINASTGVTQVQDNGGEQIADTADVTLSEAGGFDAEWQVGDSETVGSISGVGDISITGGEILSTGNNNSSTTYSGNITTTPAGSGTFSKTGTGTMTLTGNQVSTFTPTFNVDGGELVINGNWVEATTNVNGGGTLKGTGATGITTVNAAGTINAGNSPGCITVAALNLVPGSNFDEEIAGDTVCTQYDRTTVTGSANLNNAILNVQPSYTPAPGSIFTIIQAGSVIGTFSGLADGATFTANGIQFRINYTNNQVNLTVLGGTLVPTGQNHNNAVWFALAALLIGATGIGFSLRRNKLSIKRTAL